MARGIQGLPKVSPRPAMLDLSMPCGRATPEIALWPFLGRPAAVFYLLGYPTLYGDGRPMVMWSNGKESSYFNSSLATAPGETNREGKEGRRTNFHYYKTHFLTLCNGFEYAN
jgi:hypothetical protein